MPLEIRGLDELSNDLTAMAGRVGNEGHVIDRALKAGAVPIEEQMIQNATVDPKVISGDLRSSISITIYRIDLRLPNHSLYLNEKEGTKWKSCILKQVGITNTAYSKMAQQK